VVNTAPQFNMAVNDCQCKQAFHLLFLKKMKCPVCKQQSVLPFDEESYFTVFKCTATSVPHYTRTPNYDGHIVFECYVFGDIRVFTRSVFKGQTRDFTQFQLFDPAIDESFGFNAAKATIKFEYGLLTYPKIVERVERYKKALCLL